MQDGVFRRRKLPHWDVEGQPVFITACLAGSISSAGLSRIRKFRDELDSHPRPTGLNELEWDRNKHKRVFKLVDELLDQKSAANHLSDDRLAKIVQDAFLHFAGERYDLLAFAIMPSHHHWLFLPRADWAHDAVDKSQANQRSPREIISHSIQSYTATACNRALGTKGQFWQTETFDHWARNEAEMIRIINYIENNPVKAGLAETPAAYAYSSARIRLQAEIQPGEPILKSHVG